MDSVGPGGGDGARGMRFGVPVLAGLGGLSTGPVAFPDNIRRQERASSACFAAPYLSTIETSVSPNDKSVNCKAIQLVRFFSRLHTSMNQC